MPESPPASQSVTLQGPILEAETADVRQFARLLRGIGLKHNACMTVSKAGFEVTVEDAKSLSATAWIPTNVFGSYTYTGEGAEVFELSLDALLQCLNIFGSAGGSGVGPAGSGRERRMRRVPPNATGAAGKKRWAGDVEDEDEEDWAALPGKRKEQRTSMRLAWSGLGHPLTVLLRDDSKGPVTTCELYTLEPEDIVTQPFDDSKRAVYLIMKSEWFRDALLDLPPSCTRVTLGVKPNNHDDRRRGGRFSMYAEGDFGTVQFEYPNERDVMDAFECDEPIRFSYHAPHLIHLSRALQHALKICLQIEETGFLCVQVMMPIPDNLPPDMHNGILEFKMNALEDEEE